MDDAEPSFALTPFAMIVYVAAEFFCKTAIDSNVPLDGVLKVSVPLPVTLVPEEVPLKVNGKDPVLFK